MSDRITGCIIRMWHANEMVLESIAKELREQQYGSAVVERDLTSSVTSKRWIMLHMRQGNLDLDGWMRQFASDLGEMRDEGILPNLGDNLHINYELLH